MSTYDPTDEQRTLIESDDSALVIAGPGRGKTVTAVAAAQAWLTRASESSQVLFTSFSNAAVKRIAAAADINPASLDRRLQFRTFHSLAMEILRDFGRYVGLRRPASPLDGTEERLIAAERGWDKSNEQHYNDRLRSLAREEGLIAFQLMVPLATSLLQASATLRQAVGSRYPFIIIDEFQDTSADTWMFLKLLGDRSRVLALGDPNQMIYQRQHKAATRRMEEFCAWKGINPAGFDGPNFRCNLGEIVRFSESLLHGRPHVPTPTGTNGVQLFPAYPNQRRATLSALWSEIRRRAGKHSSIAFIVPSGAAARRLAAELREPDSASKVPIPIHARVETDESALDAFRLAACAAVDWVHNRTDEARQVLAIALGVFVSVWSRRTLTEQTIEKLAKRLSGSSRAVSPLRDYLTGAPPEDFLEFADGLLEALEADKEFATAGAALRRRGMPNMNSIAFSKGSLFKEYRLMRIAAGMQGTTLSSAATTVLSMYRSKGREFDFVVLVVEPRDHSSKVTVDELRRLYYVSATRAREWLGVLHVPRRAGPVLGPVIGG